MIVLSNESLGRVAEGTDPKARRTAKYLLRLRTVDQRDRAMRYSARTGLDIAVAVNMLRAYIASGTESQPMPSERVTLTLAA